MKSPSPWHDVNVDWALRECQLSGYFTILLVSPCPRHYQIMKRLSDIGGVRFRENVRKLKRRGVKTEPAIASLLQLAGDPYDSVLQIENWSDQKIMQKLNIH